MLILAGCGGGGSGSWQRVAGDGFRFAVPPSWTLTRNATTVAASAGPVDRVQVQTFRLVKPYRAELFAAASRELDRVARQVGRQLGGQVATSATVRVAGMNARTYRIEFGHKIEEITFAFAGRREYELLCRRAATASDATCRRFVASFKFVSS